MDPAEADKMFTKNGRLQSFKKGWKTLKHCKGCTPQTFANAGFYNKSSRGGPDTVKCFMCQIELGGWEAEDDPWEEHKKRGEKCMFVKLMSQKKDTQITLHEACDLYFEMRKNILIKATDDFVKELKAKREFFQNNIM